MKRTLLLFTILFFSPVMLRAQNPTGLFGIVIDSIGKGIAKAKVNLVAKSAPADTLTVSSGEDGKFRFEKVPKGVFYITIEIPGYKKLTKDFFASGGIGYDAGHFEMLKNVKELAEIVIEVPPITIKEDTVEYRADAFKVKDNAMVEDLLKKLPGVQVDRQGNVSAQGKQVSKVKVNGKDFFTNDPKTATKELPANIVDKVQVIDDYGDLAAISGIKDGDPNKVINLQLKRDKSEGYFGRATAGAGTESRYLASLNGNFFTKNQQLSVFSNSNNTNGNLFNFGSSNSGGGIQIGGGRGGGFSGIGNALSGGDIGFLQSGNAGNTGISTTHSAGLNYRNDFGNRNFFYGSYSFSNRNTDGSTITNQQNIFFDTTFINNSDSRFNRFGNNHRLFLNLELNIDSFNYLKISPSFSYGYSDDRSAAGFDYLRDNEVKTSEGYNNDTSVSKQPNISATISYNLRFRKRGRNFSANLSLGTSSSLSDQDNENFTRKYFSSSSYNDQYLLQRIAADNDNRNFSASGTYTEPLSAKRFIDLNFNQNLSYSSNDRKYYYRDPSNSIESLIDSLSNAYENDFNYTRYGLTLRTLEKKYNYTLGFNVQPVVLKGNSITKDSAFETQKRVNVFPVVRFAYKFSRSRSFNFSYYGNARQPGFSQLQPVRDISNPQYQSEGNPNLKPETRHTFNLSFNDFNFTSGQVIFSNLSISTSRNQIVNNTINLDTNGTQLTRPENVNGYYNINAFGNYSKPFDNRKYVLSSFTTVNYNHNINLLNSEKNTGNNWIVSQGLDFEFNYKEWMELRSGIRYSLNNVTYSLKNYPGQTSQSWVLSTDGRLDLPGGIIVRYDMDYTINKGISSSVSRNAFMLNASVEKQMFRKKNGYLRLQGYDLLDQNTNVSRSVTANSITDTRSDLLTRYLMLSFTYRFNKFKGQSAQSPFRGGREMMIIRQ